jgi:rhodanese-related sulfurtransferase
MSQPDDLVYAGELEPTDVWERLKSEPRLPLIDCRTIAEWSYVGVPDLSSLGQETILVEWQRFPDMSVNPDFVDTLKSELGARGLGRDTPLYFLCRSGVRSRSAAAAMTRAGYSNSYNILYGFEGNLDEAGQRGHLAGWKKSKLPWRQK